MPDRLTELTNACESDHSQEPPRPFEWREGRMFRFVRPVACGAALALLVALPMGARASSLPSAARSKASASGHFAPFPGDLVAPMAQSGNITAGSCTYKQAIDDPHISSTAPRAASVHGW